MSEPDPRLDAEELKLWDEWTQRASVMESGNAPDWAVKYADAMILARRARMKPSDPSLSSADALERLAMRIDAVAEKAQREADTRVSSDRKLYCDGQAQAWREAARMIRDAKS